MKRIVALISGRGSNMEAIVRAGLPAEIAAVISNRADAASRDVFEGALASLIDRHSPDLIALAGFMRVLSADFVRRYSGRMVNIHPSLLPAFPGLHTHRRALQEGVKLHGCTVHFVTPQVDHGPIIIQAAVPVRVGDTEATLAARVLAQEHRIYPRAIRWFVDGRLVVENGLVRVNGAEAEQFVLPEE
jgi:phosphoribosylglycinamide formyltransferase-1